jgi:hypothetical protein
MEEEQIAGVLFCCYEGGGMAGGGFSTEEQK